MSATNIKTQIVSTSKIEVPAPTQSAKKVKGADWFPLLYAIIYVLAKKNSGKTVLIMNILKHCANKNTKFIFISSTVNKDDTWKSIVDYWENEGNEVLTYTDIYDGDVSVIGEFMEENRHDDDEEEKLPPPPPQKGGLKFMPAVMPIIQPKTIGMGEKKRKPKVLAPEYIVVFDDLGKAMRDKTVEQFLKSHRHYKTKVILSGQDLKDLSPPQLKQLDYVCVFGGIPEVQLKLLRENLYLDLTEEDFEKLYHYATEKKYNFLYISARDNQFRKNFNTRLTLEEEKPAS